MKSDKFLSAIGNIDDDFIEEAAELNSPQAKRPIRKLWVRYGSLAACLLIAVFTCVHFGRRRNQSQSQAITDRKRF